MMDYEVVPTENFLREFKKLAKSLRKQVLAKLEELKTEPIRFKRLRYALSKFYSLHVGSYRVLYTVVGKKVFLHSIRHRKKVYKMILVKSQRANPDAS